MMKGWGGWCVGKKGVGRLGDGYGVGEEEEEEFSVWVRKGGWWLYVGTVAQGCGPGARAGV